MKIPVASPVIDEEDIKAVYDAVKSGFISGTGGDSIQKFEEMFARFCNTKYGVAVSNGTTALHIAVHALGIKPNDEVITTNVTNIATAFSVIYRGSKPIFVDCEPDTYNIDVSKIESKITKKTKAIMPVHIYGHPVDMDPLLEIAEKHGLFVIEDSAEAHGALYKNRKAGSLGDAGCFSFYANKIITTGEGGMIVTNNEEIANKAMDLRNLSYGKIDRFKHDDLGYNYRMSNILASLGVSQMKKIDTFIEKKRKMASLYGKLLSGTSLQLPVEKSYAKNVYWMYAVLVKGNRNAFMKKLGEKGVGTRPFFSPMSQQPVMANMGLLNPADSFPVSEDFCSRGLYLPSGTDIEPESIEYVCDSIKEIEKDTV